MRAVVLAVVLQMTTVLGTCTIDNDLTTWIETEVVADDHKAFCHCVGAAANFFNYDQAYAICNVGDPPEQSSCGTNKGCPAPHLIDQNKMTFAQCEAQCSRLVARIPRDGADLAFVYNINDNELCLEDYPEIWVASEQTVNNDLGGEEQAEEYKAFCPAWPATARVHSRFAIPEIHRSRVHAQLFRIVVQFASRRTRRHMPSVRRSAIRTGTGCGSQRTAPMRQPCTAGSAGLNTRKYGLQAAAAPRCPPLPPRQLRRARSLATRTSISRMEAPPTSAAATARYTTFYPRRASQSTSRRRRRSRLGSLRQY